MDVTVTDKKNLLIRLSPNVRRAWNHRAPEMKLKPRIIFDYELLYLERGELRIRIEETGFSLEPGDMVLFKPGKEHEFVGSAGESWMPHIHFDVLYYDNFEEVPINFKKKKECQDEEIAWIRPDVLGSILNIPDVIRIKNHSEVHKSLIQLIHTYERRDADFPILQKSIMLRILYLILKGLEANDNAKFNLHQTALENTVTHIMENYNQSISLDDLSKIACLSVYHFSRLFKQKFGVSPHQFQMQYRFEKAKELMIYSQLSLTSIAEKIGYSSVFAFSKAFKQSEGVSPRQFMQTFPGG
ncbi:helix-turn-helix domain-containing protein [Paenibacillus sedimenti]|uniref:Helix-turn-helix transcriptional regulator n=1 Tax=Paenibacillus sedimenti TaxID=2770274 RepID=A0A926KKV9_9BACL|nr:AraC family transcriptional regulator [Paenibacillus sedimenti]MBD0378856.1 helix-turn-helix transcriptional regulator [Paenibacillus sedimenti]